MSSATSLSVRTATVMAFDARGTRRFHIDDSFELVPSSGRTPFAHTFKLLLAQSPGALQWEVQIQQLPLITLTWDSVFKGAGVARVRLGDEPAETVILMDGSDSRAEAVVLDGLAETLAREPGTTVHPVFAAFRAATHRPLIAAIRFACLEDEIRYNVVAGITRSLALAFFTPVVAAAVESAESFESASIAQPISA
jgi:hypothetical protein